MNKAVAIFNQYFGKSTLGEMLWKIKNAQDVEIIVVDIAEDLLRDSVEVIERKSGFYCVVDDIPSAIYVYSDGYTQIKWHVGPDSDSPRYHRAVENGPAVILIEANGTTIEEYWLNGTKLEIVVYE